MPYTFIEKNKRNTGILVFLFTALIMGLAYVFAMAMEDISIVVIAFVVVVIFNLISFYQGDKIILAANGAKEIKKADAPELYRTVENMAITAGLPTPKVYIIAHDSPNAFATGRSPETASVTVTTGLLNLLNKQELEGVIAHELSHIKNYDIRLTMMVIMLLGIVVLMSDLFLRIGLRMKSKKGDQAKIIFLVIAVVLAILAPIVAKIMQLAISRQREFLADADSALLTRYPEGLAGALEKIKTADIPYPEASKSSANLYISNPYGQKSSWFKNLFATHPPIDERINRLRNFNF
ncbi:MAG TPA: M48 family metallopeptidase [bacterium]|nr:M48 family metallopeptidase [bacterium]